ncbi:hypothetical protein LSUE1_G000835 [Lachnellula suecica]|uniref:Uncharacterized protein n=1 Tax=Lachnellula suecica TaxID=602035 RepID=A0A8T9CJW8_9HELO|nr:hypothetical protein LSUE1_G000835 [Lachnellula suecica]
MAALDLNIKNLEFPDNPEDEETTSGKSFSGISSLFKSKSKPLRPAASIPKNYSPNDYLVFRVLREFLQPDSDITLSDAVSRVLEIFLDGYMDLRPINTVCIELAEQIPYSHPSHMKLARLLHAIGKNRQRAVKSGIKDIPEAIHSFYQDLQEDLSDSRCSPGDGGAEPMRYVNYQAFFAHLKDVGVWLPGPNGALFAMRGAFEKSKLSLGEESVAIQEAWILGAAQWVLWNGQSLFKVLLYPGDQEKQETGEFELEHWHLWRDGFNEAAASERFGEECRSVARRAAEIMDILEKSLSF